MQKKTKRQRLIALSLGVAMLAPAAMMADGLSVVVIGRDGNQHSVEIASLKKMEIGTTAVTVHHVNGTTHDHQIADVDRILIGAKQSGIDELTQGGSIAVWPQAVTDDRVNVAGADPATAVTVSDINGRTVTATVGEAGASTIDVSTLAKGVIIVSVNNHTVKLIKH